MKCVLFTVLLTALCAVDLLASSGAIRTGDSRDHVEAVLGSPTGWIQGGSYELLLYERGSVEIRDGAVSEVAILTAEQHERRLRERKIRAAERREAEAARRALRITQGNALKTRTVGDVSFLSSAPESQLRFWRNFKQRYPEVPAELGYRDALSAYEREQQTRRAKHEIQLAAQQLERLERKAEEAERDAEDAERRAVRADRRRRSVVYSGVSAPCVGSHRTQPRVEYVSARPGFLPSTISSGVGNRSVFRQTYSAGHTYARTPWVNSGGLTIHIRN